MCSRGGVLSKWFTSVIQLRHAVAVHRRRRLRQLTNVGITDVGQEFVPVPLHEVAIVESRLVYAVIEAEIDTSELEGPAPGAIWAVDVNTGEAELLGEGRFPEASTDGVIATVDDTPGAGCATTYAPTEGP